MAVDTSAGDSTPKLTQASIIKAVTAVNLLYANLEVPLAGVNGPIRINRDVNISTLDGQRLVYGTQLTVSQGTLRSTILQQSVNTNDERVYLLNNASADAGATFTGNFVYDKTGAAASNYLQQAGQHFFATAPNGTKDSAVTFTNRVKIDSNGLTVLAGAFALTNNVAANSAMATFANNTNGTNLVLASVNSTDAYIQGSFLADSAIRAETGNLVIGSLSGNTTIGTSTKTLARWNSNGTVIFPGTNVSTSTYGGFSVGSGITAVVGAGSNSASDAKAFWIYSNNTPNFIGGGMQFNAQNGLDFWTGNSGGTAWIRTLQVQTGGKVLVGGVQAATAIGDLHINAQGADQSGSLSLTGLSNASFILMGNRDSQGTAGPSIIAASNRRIQFGVGDSFVTRGGGTFTEYACFYNASFGIGTTSPDTYGPLAVNVTNGSAIGQVVVAAKSPATLGGNGTNASGLGIYWGNNVFVGMRVTNGGDANNSGLNLMVGSGGSSINGLSIGTDRNVTVAGTTLSINTTNVLSCDASNQTYLRGSLIALQSTGAVNYLLANSTSVTLVVDAIANGNLTVSGTIISSRQIEKTTDKVIGSGVVVFDYNSTALWMSNGATANWTANFTNIGTSPGQAITVSIIHQQGSTGYYPSAVQINGSAATIKWAGGMAPVPTPNNVDMFTFTLIRTTSNTWLVLGSATPYV